MATQTATRQKVIAEQHRRTGIFSGRKGQKRRDALLAYLLLFPAMVIIGIFGLFPLVFSVYQSTRAGLNNVVGRPDGFGQYIRAIDNLAYVLAFGLALFFLFVAVNRLAGVYRLAKQHAERPLPWVAPSLAFASALSLLGVFVFVFMPGLLEIGEKMNELRLPAEERAAQFPVFLAEAWQVQYVQGLFWSAVGLLLLGAVLFFLFDRRLNHPRRSGDYVSGLTSGLFLLALAGALTWLTFAEIQLAYAEALEAGEPLSLWAQIVTIGAGFVLLLLSWLVWQRAAFQSSNFKTGLRFFAAILLMIGGWILIAELPAAIAEGKQDWWDGLLNTVYYAIGSLPIQLGLGLMGATLLFQDIKAKGLLRVIYFLPFITPAVGSAAVFRVLFNGNPNSPMNLLSTRLGADALKWLNEPTGINQLIGNALGFAVPGWAAGPSLALVVVIIYSVWRYTGYNIVFFLAGLGNISKELYEAAAIDGANRWQQFRNITIPLLSPVTYFLTIFGVIGTFKAFNTIFVLRTQAALGTMDTASLVIFDAFNRDTRYGYAAALGIILLIIILSATAVLDRFAKGKVFYG